MLQVAKAAGVVVVGEDADEGMVDGLSQVESRLMKREQEVGLKKELAKVQLLRISAPLRAELIENLKGMMKESMLADPDMWTSVETLTTDLRAEI